MRTMLIVLSALCVLHAPIRAEDKPDPRENLDTAIAEAILLIEAKDTTGMIKTFVPPDALKHILEKRTIEEMVKDVEKNLPGMLKMLRKAQEVKPTLSNSDAAAPYVFEEEIDGKKELKLIKVDRFWYLK